MPIVDHLAARRDDLDRSDLVRETAVDNSLLDLRFGRHSVLKPDVLMKNQNVNVRNVKGSGSR